jgi:hypothetical protein
MKTTLFFIALICSLSSLSCLNKFPFGGPSNTEKTRTITIKNANFDNNCATRCKQKGEKNSFVVVGGLCGKNSIDCCLFHSDVGDPCKSGFFSSNCLGNAEVFRCRDQW